MTETKKKGKTQIAVVAILFFVLMGNFARQSHAEIRTVDFIQILGMGMLLGVLLMSVLHRPKSN